jgi:hypothetical protein
VSSRRVRLRRASEHLRRVLQAYDELQVPLPPDLRRADEPTPTRASVALPYGDRRRRASRRDRVSRQQPREASIDVAVRLWWTSRLRGRRFAQLLQQARDVTQERISRWVVERSEPGRRKAMPYFLAVLRQLAERERTSNGSSSAMRRLVCVARSSE